MLAIDRLSFAFGASSVGTSLRVIQDVSLTVGQGEVVVLVGPSGCGKSTLLNLVAGILTPCSGRIDYPIHGRDRRVGYVFQTPSLVPWLTVWENAKFGAEIACCPQQETESEASRLMADYGLADFRNSFPSQLSGGMQQRVALVRAILAGAQILLLDEPFSNSDHAVRGNLQRDVSKAVEEEGLMALLVTHDLEEAVMLGDKIIILTDRPARVKCEVVIPVARKIRERKGARMEDFLVPYLDAVWHALAV